MVEPADDGRRCSGTGDGHEANGLKDYAVSFLK